MSARTLLLGLLLIAVPASCGRIGVDSQLDVRNHADVPVYVRVGSFTYLVPPGTEGVIAFSSGPGPAPRPVDVLAEDCTDLGSVIWPRDEAGSTIEVAATLRVTVVPGRTALGATQSETPFQESASFCR